MGDERKESLIKGFFGSQFETPYVVSYFLKRLALRCSLLHGVRGIAVNCHNCWWTGWAERGMLLAWPENVAPQYPEVIYYPYDNEA